MDLQENGLEVIDKNGWRKIVPLPPKSIVHLGSHAENDIILTDEHGQGVAPLHAQIIAPTNDRAGYQLVNLSETDIALGAGGEQSLPARTSMDLTDGTTFRIGDFTLVFRGGGGYFGGPIGRQSANIGLQLRLEQTKLAPGQAIDGWVTVRNRGQQTGVQFEVELEGLDTACFDLEPGPLLSSGAEKEIFLRIYHRGPKPTSGDCKISVKAIAPKSYRGEQVMVSQMVEVMPYFRHAARLLRPDGSSKLPRAEDELELLPKPESPKSPWRQEQPSPAEQTTPAVTAQEAIKVEADNWWSSPAPAASPAAAEQEAADWWSTPEPETEPQPAPASPAAAAQKTADWWSAAASEAEPQPAPAPPASSIPPGAHVPRQADDWWSGAAEPEPAEPEPTEADDWWTPGPPAGGPDLPDEEAAPAQPETAPEPPPDAEIVPPPDDAEATLVSTQPLPKAPIEPAPPAEELPAAAEESRPEPPVPAEEVPPPPTPEPEPPKPSAQTGEPPDSPEAWWSAPEPTAEPAPEAVDSTAEEWEAEAEEKPVEPEKPAPAVDQGKGWTPASLQPLQPDNPEDWWAEEPEPPAQTKPDDESSANREQD